MLDCIFPETRFTGTKLFHQFKLLAVSLCLSISVAACGGGVGGEEPTPIEPLPLVPSHNFGKLFMPAGFYAVSDNGVTQIDENFRNYGLVTKGSSNVNGNNLLTLSVTNSTAPILCIRPTVNAIAFYDFSLNVGGTSSWRLVADYGFNAPFDYWIFDAERLGTDVGPGLAVYNAQGQLVYSSNTAEFRVVGSTTSPAFPYVWGESNNGAPGPITRSIPANSAVCVNTSKSYYAAALNAPARLLLEGVKIQGTTLTIENVNAASGPILGNDNGDWPMNNGESSFLFVDIGNI